MLPSPLLALLLAAAPHLFESAAGYGLDLPDGFALDARLPRGETGSAGPAGEAARATIDAAFSDVASGGHESLVVSQVFAPLPSGRDETTQLAALTLDWAERRLDGALELQWVDHLETRSGPGVEVALRLRSSSDGASPEDRALLVMFVPMGAGYLTFVASVPSGRFPVQGPRVEQAFRSVHLASPSPTRGANGWIGALIGALLGLGLVAFARRHGRLGRRAG
ncbi:MAG: hypothetical protein ACYCWW_13390 [Deltaproteobacteria bacterium]